MMFQYLLDPGNYSLSLVPLVPERFVSAIVLRVVKTLHVFKLDVETGNCKLKRRLDMHCNYF